LKTMIVYFQDGEVLKGTGESLPTSEKRGFWIVPEKKREDVDRVFVAISATKKTELLKG